MQPMKLHTPTPDTRTKEQFVSDELAEINGRRLASGRKKLSGEPLETFTWSLGDDFDNFKNH
jgi:hypothetical protein